MSKKKQFKFDLGQIVVHKTNPDYPFLVLARGFMESEGFEEELYICASEQKKMFFLAPEIESFRKDKQQ